MSGRWHVFVAALFAVTLAGPVRALEWKKREISVTPERGADVVRLRFEFKNTSQAVVSLLGITTSCGCTEATPTASEFKPGETGALDVLFTIGRRTGLQEKEITVMTSESNVPVRLTVKIKLPDQTILQEVTEKTEKK
jgi:hypothetical protein